MATDGQHDGGRQCRDQMGTWVVATTDPAGRRAIRFAGFCSSAARYFTTPDGRISPGYAAGSRRGSSITQRTVPFSTSFRPFRLSAPLEARSPDVNFSIPGGWATAATTKGSARSHGC